MLRAFADLGAPEGGWIRAIREALGLTTTQMARKTGFDQSRISRLEKAEKGGNLTLSSLQRIAKGMGMRFVYGFVSEKSLEQIVRDRAQELVLKQMQRLDHTMALELQGLSSAENKKALKDTADKLLIDRPKGFWDDE